MGNQKDNLNGCALLLVIIDWNNVHHLVHYGDSYGLKYVMCPFLLLLRWIGNNENHAVKQQHANMRTHICKIIVLPRMQIFGPYDS